MKFTPTAATAVLAFCSGAFAAPPSESKTEYHTTMSTSTMMYGTKTAESMAKPTMTGASDALAKLGLSKTQQIFLSDTRVDAINNVLKDDKDFVFNFFDAQTGGPGKGGEVVPANRKTFPALTNTNIGGAVGFLGPCGFNTPHVHPRATEFLFLFEGEIMSEMVPENGVVDANGKRRDIRNKLEKFDSTVYFQGSIHSQFNTGCGNATFFAALSSEDFGVGQAADELFSLDDDTIAAVFGNNIDGARVDELRGFIPESVALGVEQCLKKCNIPKRK